MSHKDFKTVADFINLSFGPPFAFPKDFVHAAAYNDGALMLRIGWREIVISFDGERRDSGTDLDLMDRFTITSADPQSTEAEASFETELAALLNKYSLDIRLECEAYVIAAYLAKMVETLEFTGNDETRRAMRLIANYRFQSFQGETGDTIEKTMFERSINLFAGSLYDHYCTAVGGVNFIGDPLPSWEVFGSDLDKQKQADGWRSLAAKITCMIGGINLPTIPYVNDDGMMGIHTLPVENLASYADAVCAANCSNLEFLESSFPDQFGDDHFKVFNTTSVGNLAYIALHCEHEAYRIKALEALEAYRAWRKRNFVPVVRVAGEA